MKNQEYLEKIMIEEVKIIQDIIKKNVFEFFYY